MKGDKQMVNLSLTLADVRALRAALAVVGGHENQKSLQDCARRLETLRRHLDLVVAEQVSR